MRISDWSSDVCSSDLTAYVCSECGAEHNKWQGQCAECGAWNTLSEIVLEPAAGAPAASRRSGWAGKLEAPRITALKDVRSSEIGRASRRERVCQSVSLTTVAGSLKTKKTKTTY